MAAAIRQVKPSRPVGFVGRNLEIGVPLIIWSLALGSSWFRYFQYGPPYTMDTFGLILLCLGCAFLPAFLISRNSIPSAVGEALKGTLIYRRPILAVSVSTGFLLLATAIFIVTRRRMGLGDLDVSEMRQVREELAGQSAGLIGQLNYIFISLGMPAPYLVARLAIPTRLRIACCCAFGIAFAAVYLLTGLRSEYIPVLALAIASFLVFKGESIVRVWKRALVFGVGIIALIVLGNTYLSVVGLKGGGAGQAAEGVAARGDLLLAPLGINNMPFVGSLAVGMFDEYVFLPPAYLDYYLSSGGVPPAMGALQFNFIARRIGFESLASRKAEADLLYEPLGINYNVWATGIREMAIDFGIFGVPVVFLLLGTLMGVGKRLSSDNWAAGYIYCLICSFFICSPLISIFRSQFVEMGFYSGLIWFFATSAFSRKQKV